MTQLSIIIPVLNEEALVADQIAHVRQISPRAELILVDGGSTDGTARIAKPLADHFVQTESGRARQMNAGAQFACGKYLLFLHADTRLPEDLESLLTNWSQTDPMWGYFQLQLTGEAPVFRLVESMINLRTKVTSGATGDQGQMVRRDVFTALGGFPDLPLMEDLALSRRLRKLMPPKILPGVALSSSRRWEDKGIVRTVLLMWFLRGIYTLGVHPRHFFKAYRQYS